MIDFSYEQITAETEKRIQEFLDKASELETAGDREGARIRRHWAFGAYFLWGRLCEGCIEDADYERLSRLSGVEE